METPSTVLDYGQPKPPSWRVYGWRFVVVGLAMLLVAALVGACWIASAAWQRYRHTREYQAGYAALATYVIPAGTVLLDPAVGIPTTQQTYSQGWYLNILAQNDPVVVRNLLRMGDFDSFCVFPYAGERRTPRGTAFVFSRIRTDRVGSPPSGMTLLIGEEYMTPGRFPLYQYTQRGWFSQLDFLPSAGHHLPTILAGYPDPSGSSWTLPLIVDGRHEWVRIDHTGTYPSVTASFGQIHPTNRPYELRY